MGSIDERLTEIVGDRYISGKPEEVSKYFREKVTASALKVVFPETHQEIQAVVRVASDTNIPVFTIYDRYLPQKIASGPGIVIDFRNMNKIERVDKRNLIAHIQRGVTFEQLQKELKKEGLKIAPPAAATSELVLPNLVNRACPKAAVKYPEVPVTNMYVVLADGRLHKTGSHALSEETSDSKSEGGADISKWYLASEDTFGIVTRASIYIYPMRERRSVLVFDFDGLAGALKALKEVPRRELGIEYLAMDARYLDSLVDVKEGELSPWTVLVGFDGREEHVTWQEKMVRGFIEEMGGNANDALVEILAKKIDEAWPVMTEYHTGFYTLFDRVADLDESLRDAITKKGYPAKDIGRLMVSVDRGRTAYCSYEFFKDGIETDRLVDELQEMLLDKGAFYDRPLGGFAQTVFSKIDGYTQHLKRIKTMMDPKGILNPGLIKF